MLATIVTIVALLAAMAALAGPLGDVILPEDEAELPSTNLNQIVEANGVTMELTNAQYANAETILHLVVSRDAEPAFAEALLPIRAPQIETTNVGGDPFTFGSTTFYDDAAGQGVLGIDLAVGPIMDSSQPVTVTIKELNVQQGSGQSEAVTGPWTFEFDPTLKADVGNETPQVINVDKTATTDVVEIDVSNVEVSQTGIVVHYRVPELGSGQFMPMDDTLRVQFPDGTVHIGEPTLASDPNGERIIRFPALPDGAASLTLQFGSFIVARDGTAEVSFEIPNAFWDAESNADVPLETSFELGGERLALSAISHTELPEGSYTDGASDVTVSIEVDQSGGSISLAGPQSNAMLVDNLGNSYLIAGGGFGSDSSGFSFYGPIDPDATSLTLTVDSHGEIVPAPEPMTIDVPGR